MEVIGRLNHPTIEQIEVEKGWRLVELSEYEDISSLPKNDETIEVWERDHWDIVPTLHLDTTRIYRTKRKS